MRAPDLTIVNAEIAGRGPLDIEIVDGRVRAFGPGLARGSGDSVIDAAGAVVLPGLHDHHLHLFALAAADASARCGPPDVASPEALREALTRGAPGEWVRGIGYHASVAGELDRWALDALVEDRPVRVQHRSGMLWIVNSAAAARLGLDGVEVPGVERDEHGRPTGRLFRLDGWIRTRLGDGSTPRLDTVGRRLAGVGITGVTDATPGNGPSELRVFEAALDAGDLPQRLLVMGSETLPESQHGRVRRGAVKVLLDEHALPALEELRDLIAAAHGAQRAVAVHCVTRATLVLAATAVAEAGAVGGDRIEHASVAPPPVLELLADLPLTVVTQPTFVVARGDAYLREVPADEQPWLYRGRGFLDAGVALAAGSDAPFGDLNPWIAMQAAVDRRTRNGAVLAPDEQLTPEEALALFSTPLGAPGGAPRAIVVDAPADLIVLDRSWSEARRALADVAVHSTICAGRVVENETRSTRRERV